MSSLTKYVYLCVQKCFMFTKTCQYGIKATVFIAQQSLQDNRVTLNEVAESIESPTAYTSKILQKLSRNSLINSNKGPSGGFSISMEVLDSLKLEAIVRAIDGEKVFNDCGLGFKSCDINKPCPIHDQFKQVRNEFRNMLKTTSIKALAMDFDKGLIFLKA